jgi:hypothetical protein
MAWYKDASFDQSMLIPIVLSQQITLGTFEYAVSLLVEAHLDRTICDCRYNNNDVGRLA